MKNAICRECGAALPDSGSCIENFHAMLFLENTVVHSPNEVSGDSGEVAHFYAVSAYILQHPEAMGFTVAALTELRLTLRQQVGRGATLAQIKVQTRRTAEGARRITRRPGDEVPRWGIQAWPVTVADVLSGGAADYVRRARAWAESILDVLEASEGRDKK